MPSTYDLFIQAKDFWNNVVVAPIFDENVTANELYMLSLILAAIVFVSFELLRPLLNMIAKGPLLPRIRKIADLEYDRPGETQEIKKFLGITTKEKYFEHLKNSWGAMFLINFQHLVAGFFAIPAVLGMVRYSQSVRSSLACLGIMVEMGWEVQDTCRILYNRLLKGEDGKKAYPDAVVVILIVHHSLTCIMGPPMILNYRGLAGLHRLCFNLAGAAGSVGLFSEFCRALDVKKKNELLIFVITSFLMIAVMLWTRFFDWFYISCKLLATFYMDKRWIYMIVGGPILFLFSLFNFFLCVIPGCKRFIKFWKKLREFQSLPETADDKIRRSTVLELQTCAGEFAATELNAVDALATLFEARDIERRHSITISELSRSAALAAAAEQASFRRPPRASMVAFRGLPSRVKKREESKSD